MNRLANLLRRIELVPQITESVEARKEFDRLVAQYDFELVVKKYETEKDLTTRKVALS